MKRLTQSIVSVHKYAAITLLLGFTAGIMFTNEASATQLGGRKCGDYSFIDKPNQGNRTKLRSGGTCPFADDTATDCNKAYVKDHAASCLKTNGGRDQLYLRCQWVGNQCTEMTGYYRKS